MNWEIEHPYGESGTYIGDENTALICKIYPDGERHRHLIAAAPDMYEALKDVLDELHKHHKMNVKKDYSLMIADSMARKAIAKAERGE